MFFRDIRLQHLRSYTEKSFEFGPQVNIIVGPNASGKTNLLEAVLLAGRGKSYRAKDVELLEHNQPWARIDTQTGDNETRTVLLEEEGRVHKRFKIDEQSLYRLLLPRTVPIVLFEPEHLQLLSGTPDLRRQFLDDILEQTVPGFSLWRRQYRRILAQRNAVLKRYDVLPQDQLFVWDIRLAEFGERIALARHGLVEKIRARIDELYKTVSQTDTKTDAFYEPVVPLEGYASALLHKLEAHREQDFIRGFTAYGPHREDMAVRINSYPVQETASRGEVRTLLLVCKIVEAIVLEEARSIRPLLLLDDVFSELDSSRRRSLITFLQSYQTFVTTTDADIVVSHFKKQAQVISLT